MLQELAASTGATAWAIASMLFFLGVYVLITVRVFRARPEDLDARARLALEGDPPSREAPRWTSPPSRDALRRASADGDDGPGSNEGRPAI